MSNLKHGKRHSKVYGIWCAMKRRCFNKNVKAYKDYGGRGITVCDRWLKFENFYMDMGDPQVNQSIERRDNNKGYSPDNCIWIHREMQSRNRRGLRMIEVDGKVKTMSEWAEITGISITTIWARLKKGWSHKEAISIPIVTKRLGIKRGEKLRMYA